MAYGTRLRLLQPEPHYFLLEFYSPLIVFLSGLAFSALAIGAYFQIAQTKRLAISEPHDAVFVFPVQFHKQFSGHRTACHYY
jgi:hypothetical protein